MNDGVLVRAPTCSMCQDAMGCNDLLLVATVCGHVYHEACMIRWRNARRDANQADPDQVPCPDCRADLDVIEDVGRLYLQLEKVSEAEIMGTDDNADAALTGLSGNAEKLERFCRFIRKSHRAESKGLKKELKKVKEQHERAQAELRASKEEVRELTRARDKLAAEAAHGKAVIRQANEYKASQDGQMIELRARVKELRAERDAARGKLKAVNGMHSWLANPESDAPASRHSASRLDHADSDELRRELEEVSTALRILKREHRRVLKHRGGSGQGAGQSAAGEGSLRRKRKRSSGRAAAGEGPEAEPLSVELTLRKKLKLSKSDLQRPRLVDLCNAHVRVGRGGGSALPTLTRAQHEPARRHRSVVH